MNEEFKDRMSKSNKPYRIILSGGGTGGHIYPAIAVATRLKSELPNCEILFVGAEGKMEMEKVPKAGFKIIGLPVAGLQRRFTLKNLLFPFKLIMSLIKAKKVVKSFAPDILIGFGGYASGPVLKVASKLNLPFVLQEQNSFAGLTNKLLGKNAKKICVAYKGMEKYFPKDSIVLTGNPVRKDINQLPDSLSSKKFFGFDGSKKVILIIGGSLGARTINESLEEGIKDLGDYDVLWQTGKFYFDKLKDLNSSNVVVRDFIYEMDQAYAAADVVISRAGALSVSEICLAKKATILVPSPNVAEDHQTKNAEALLNEDAAVLVKDVDAKKILIKEVKSLLDNSARLDQLSRNIEKCGFPMATENIVKQVIEILD